MAEESLIEDNSPIKTEPKDFEDADRSLDDTVRVKLELEELYGDHVIDEEMVIGPTIVSLPVTSPVLIRDNGQLTKTVERRGSARELKVNYNFKLKLKHNLKEVLEYSNATLFSTVLDNKFYCCFCTERFDDAAQLKGHCQAMHFNADLNLACSASKYYAKLDITDLQCSICDEYCKSLEYFISHLKQQHHIFFYTDIQNKIIPFKFSKESTEFSCCICSRTFDKFKLLLTHMNAHYTQFECEICGAGFITWCMAKTHVRSHDGDITSTTFPCSVCSKSFATLQRVKYHENTVHNGVKRNVCTVCNEKFSNYRQKMIHLESVHGKDFSVKCTECDKILPTAARMRMHVRKDHLKECRYVCADCGKKFFENRAYKLHMSQHTGIKQFKCDICNKCSYAVKSHLKRHKRIHHNVI